MDQCIRFESWEPLFARCGYAAHDVFGALIAGGFALYRLQPPVLVPVSARAVSTRCENLIAVRDVGALLRRGLSAGRRRGI